VDLLASNVASEDEPRAETSSARRTPRRIRGLQIAAGVALAAIAVSWLGRWWAAGDLIAQFTTQLVVVLAGLGLLLAVTRQWGWSAICYIAALPAAAQLVWLYLPAAQGEPMTQPLRILSFNLLITNTDYQRIIDLVERVDPDVICFAELESHLRDGLAPLATRYPYSAGDSRYWNLGTVILSRHPLLKIPGEETLGMAHSPLAAAQIDWEGRRLTLVAVHTKSPTSLARVELRDQQLASLERTIDRLDGPVAVVGDFNATMWSTSLRRLLARTGLRDSRHGFGIQPTWPAWAWPLRIPIDHVLVSPDIRVHRRWIEKPAGSDHLPVVTEISIGREP